jgi:hypothetical protein
VCVCACVCVCARACVCVQAGTLSGNPLAMTAGIKTLEILQRPGSYEHLDKVPGHLPPCCCAIALLAIALTLRSLYYSPLALLRSLH